jgi:hypothetical protein
MPLNKRPSRGWLAADAGWALVFLYAGVVNLNDPDPLIWVVLYGTGCAACGVHAMGQLGRRTAWGLSALYLVLGAWVASHGIESSHRMEGFPQYGLFREEVVREALGLWLVCGWLAVLGRWPSRTDELDSAG